MDKVKSVLSWVKSQCTTKRLIFCVIAGCIAYMLVGCSSTKHMSVTVDTADNLKVDYLDSIHVNIKR